MANPAIDMTGMKVGHLTVLSRAENTSQNKAQWLCRCDCGNYTVVSRRHLKNAGTNSCGCYAKEVARKTHTTHGMKKTRLYRIWSGMKDRCLNPNSRHWKHYGGRGIAVFDKWADDFSSFAKWSMDNGYSESLTLDRINNDAGYTPDNCRWATYKEQENNRRNNVRITINGVSKTVAEWSQETGVHSSHYYKIAKEIKG